MIRVYKGRSGNVDNSIEQMFCLVVTDFRSTLSPRGDTRAGGLEPRGDEGPGEEDEEEPKKGREEET